MLYDKLLHIDWIIPSSFTEVDTAVDSFCEMIYDVFDQEFTTVKETSPSSSAFPACFSFELTKSINTKNKARKCTLETSCTLYREMVKNLSAVIKDLGTREYQSYIFNIRTLDKTFDIINSFADYFLSGYADSEKFHSGRIYINGMNQSFNFDNITRYHVGD